MEGSVINKQVNDGEIDINGDLKQPEMKSDWFELTNKEWGI